MVHVVYRFATGGLENGIVNLVNDMPADAYRHAVVALTEVEDFRKRIRRSDVEFYSLNKGPGHGVWLYPRLFRLFRRLRPAVVHSRNLAALEAVVPAWLAGVPVRIHGEHGRDVGDLEGASRKYQLVRKFYRPFVSHYVALSMDLANYLKGAVHIPSNRITQAYNGVDSRRFTPRGSRRPQVLEHPFNDGRFWVIGTVGRMQSVKDQMTLARAFIGLLEQYPSMRQTVRLVMVGDGPLRENVSSLIEAAEMNELVWLPGERTDVADIMSTFDCFVLPSLAEGISNTILEAMACGLPVIATAVGGNSELVITGETGQLVPASDPDAIARHLADWIRAPERARALGQAGRRLVEQKFNMSAMIQAYQGLYDRQLGLRHASTCSASKIHVRNHRHL